MPTASITVNSDGTLTLPSPTPGWLSWNDSTCTMTINQNGNYTLTFNAASGYTFSDFTWTNQNILTYTNVSSSSFEIGDNMSGSASPAGSFTVKIGSTTVDPTIDNNPTQV